MTWFKKKIKQNNTPSNFTPIYAPPPPTPRHIVPIQELTRFAESAFNAGDKEVEADTLRSLINHINRYLDKTNDQNN